MWWIIAIPLGLAREAWALLVETIRYWAQDGVPRMAAAAAFYTLFSLAPALLIGMAVAEFVIGSSAARSELTSRLGQLIGPDATSFVLSVMETSRGRMTGGTATIIGTATALFGATVVFAELQSSLNSIWNVRPKAGISVGKIVYMRLVSFGLVVGIGLLLVLSLALSATLSAISTFLSKEIPVPPFILTAMNNAITFGIIPILLMLAYKLLPDVRVEWRDVWIGAVVTSLLLAVGKSFIGLYLGRSSLSSVYGAAGSLVIIMAWVYYSAQVFFFGAELTKVYALRYGSYADNREMNS